MKFKKFKKNFNDETFDLYNNRWLWNGKVKSSIYICICVYVCIYVFLCVFVWGRKVGTIDKTISWNHLRKREPKPVYKWLQTYIISIYIAVFEVVEGEEKEDEKEEGGCVDFIKKRN